MPASSVHVLTCETRPYAINGTAVRDLRLRTMRGALGPGFVVTELCAGMTTKGQSKVTGLRKLASYAAHAPPDDVILFGDSDVLFIGRAVSPAEVIHRFELAQRNAGSKIIFQAEPHCWAPSSHRVTAEEAAALKVEPSRVRNTITCTEAMLQRSS